MAKLKFIFFLLFLSSSSLFALYTGNPAEPILLKKGIVSPLNTLVTVTTGYLYTQVFNMDIIPKEIPDEVSIEKMGDTELFSNMASLGLIILKRLEVYGYLGTSKENIDWTSKIPFTSEKLDVKSHFAFSVGAKAIMLQFGSTVFSLDFQYFTLPSTEKLIPRIVNIYMPIPIGKQYLKMNEWQIAGGVASKIGPFTPYIGGKYSHVRLKVKSTEGIPDLVFRRRHNYGMFVGASLNFSFLMSATFEARLFDETAISAAVNMVF